MKRNGTNKASAKIEIRVGSKPCRVWLVASSAVVLALTACYGGNAFAEGSAPNCSPSAFKARERHNLPTSGYWMQYGGDRWITSTKVGGTYSQLYDSVERRARDISRGWDATVVPDGDLYIHPAPMRFMRMKDAMAQGEAAQPIYTDQSHNGNYQSIGTLANNGNTRRFRVLMGEGSGTARDYKIVKNGDDYQITPEGPVTTICGNVRERAPDNSTLTTETPMLSKDGKMMSGRDNISGKTFIYKIAMPSGNCTKVSEIPEKTSKVSFSFDNKKVLYTLQDPETEKNMVMELDIATGKRTQISAPGEETLYHGYKPDGSIMYTRRKEGPRNGEESELMIIDPASVPLNGSNEAKPFEAIGKIWAAACNKEVSTDGAVAAGSRIDRQNCTSLITDSAVQSLAQGFTKAQLLAACGTRGTGTAGAQTAQ